MTNVNLFQNIILYPFSLPENCRKHATGTPSLLSRLLDAGLTTFVSNTLSLGGFGTPVSSSFAEHVVVVII